AFVPITTLKDVIFWSTIAFAFGGVESASTMGEEIEHPRRTIPRAILAAGAIMTVLYLIGTLMVLLAIPKEQISGLQGIMQAIQAMTGRVGVSWLAPIVAAWVSMGIIAYFIPFLFMFAAMIVLQREPAGPDVIRVPGGSTAAIALAALGFVTTAVSIVLACVPADDEPNKMLAVVKVVGSSLALVAIGAVIYLIGRRRSASA